MGVDQPSLPYLPLNQETTPYNNSRQPTSALRQLVCRLVPHQHLLVSEVLCMHAHRFTPDIPAALHLHGPTGYPQRTTPCWQGGTHIPQDLENDFGLLTSID